MLTQQQIEQYRAKYGIQPQATQASQASGMSAAERIAALKAKPTPMTAQPEQSFLQDAGQDIKQTGEGLGRAYEETKKKLGEISDAQASGEQGFGRSFLQSAGTVAGGISSGIGEVFKGAVKTAIPQSWETGIKEGITTGVKAALPVAKSIDTAIGSPVQSAIKSYETASPASKRDIDALLGAGSLALDVATAGFGKKAGETVVKKGVEVAGELGTKAVRTGEAVIKEAKPAVKSAAERIKELAYPSPTPIKAVGEVAQGTSKDITPVVKALSALDTTGVKTFSDLGGKIKGKIKELSKQVDADLAIDATKKTLGDLNIIEKTKDGLDVVTNPVKTALDNLSEYYTKIGDNLKLAEVESIVKKAVTEGIDNVDINNLAREYGRNFNAFNKMGDPLTSVTKQGYELTRGKLKDLARSGLSGDAAKSADDTISALYDTQRLIDKSVEGVNKLQQKIRERGLVEKIGHAVTKYADLLTGGSLRGMVAGVMPRGQGYKTLNALDLQDLLQKNLEIIQKAIQTKSDDEIVKIINTMQKRVAPAKVVVPKKEPLLLNAPKPGVPRKSFGSSPVINLPKKTQTTIEKVANKQILPKQSIKQNVKSQPLIQEAKKYKSAEEFVNSQGNIVYRGGQEISSNNITNSGISVSTSKNVASDFAKQKGGSVSENIISKDAKILNYKDVPGVNFKYLNDYSPELDNGNKQIWKDLEVEYQKAIDYAKKNGYDAVKLPLEGETRIINKDIIKTKSQLEDIWNKANGKTMLPTQGTPKKVSINGKPREYAKDLTDEDKTIETKAFNRIDREADKIIKAEKDKNGNVINTDNFRPYFKDDGYKGYNAASVQEPASELSKKAFAEALKNKGKYATFYAGGSGTGKTSAVKNISSINKIINDSAVVLDGNLSSYDSAIKKIIEATGAGKRVPIIYVYRDPIDSLVNGVVKRSINNIDEAGRIVKNSVIADNHIGSWETVRRLFKEGFDVKFIDNSLGAGKAKRVTYDDLVNKIKHPSKEKLTQMFNNKIKELYDSKTAIGKRAITEEEFAKYIE